MKLHKGYQYIELYNSVVEFHKYLYMDLHIDLYKSRYIHKSNYGTLYINRMMDIHQSNYVAPKKRIT